MNNVNLDGKVMQVSLHGKTWTFFLRVKDEMGRLDTLMVKTYLPSLQIEKGDRVTLRGSLRKRGPLVYVEVIDPTAIHISYGDSI